jgi:hypothetical protein
MRWSACADGLIAFAPWTKLEADKGNDGVEARA